MIGNTMRGTLIGGLLGGLFGVIGPSLYALGTYGFMAIYNCIQKREILFGFGDFFFLALMAMGLPLGLLPQTVAVCGVSGALAGLIASTIASRSSRSSIVAVVVCGVIAIVPVVILLSRPLGPYLSTSIVVYYLPSVLFVGTMALLGALVHRYVAALAPRNPAHTGGDSAFDARHDERPTSY